MKLTVELVPEMSWYTNVRSNVDKDTWDVIRRKCYRNADYQCEICGGIGPTHPVECHEIWEYNDDEHIQKLVRFIALCPACHQVKHFGLASLKGKGPQAVDHFKEVNGVDNAEVNAYLTAVFDQWDERSNHQWTVDIEYIKEYLE